MSHNKFKFEPQEHIFCYDGSLLYEAKCVKTERIHNTNKYFIHYKGWNKRRDEWVSESRVLKWNKHNLQRQQELRRQLESQYQESQYNNSKSNTRKRNSHVLKNNNSGKDSIQWLSNASNYKKLKTYNKSRVNVSSNTSLTLNKANQMSEQQNKGQTILSFVETEEAINSKPEIDIKMCDKLKRLLVSDCDLITKYNKLVRLPSRITVHQILDLYLKQKLSTKLTQSRKSAIIEVVNGIKEYFDAMLGSQLLYKIERLQYQNQLSEHEKDTKMSSVYGSIHLLRLFAKMEHFLSFTELDNKSTQLLSIDLNDFLKYLTKNSLLFSPNDYSDASVEYYPKTTKN